MRPILIDESMLEMVQVAEEITVSPIVIGELLFGFDNGTKAKQNRLDLQKFLESPRVTILPIISETAHFFSQVML